MVPSGVATIPVSITIRQREKMDLFPTGMYGITPDSCSHASMTIDAMKRTGIVRYGPTHFSCRALLRLLPSGNDLFDTANLSFMRFDRNITPSQSNGQNEDISYYHCSAPGLLLW